MFFKGKDYSDQARRPGNLSSTSEGSLPRCRSGGRAAPVFSDAPDTGVGPKLLSLPSLLVTKTFIHRKESVLSSECLSGAQTALTPGEHDSVPRRTFCLTSASLTVECALVLPVFLFCMIIVLHYASVFRAAAGFSSRMTETAEHMALAAYREEYGDSDSLIRGALSQSYAYAEVVLKTPDRKAVKGCSFLASSFLKDGSTIDLILTYQPDLPFSLIRVPLNLFVQRAQVRGWTGRTGTASVSGADSQDEEHTQVYVTDHGTVYHTDPDCSHLKLTITQISKDRLGTARSLSGARYRRCQYCGKAAAGQSSVYVNPYGECYHSSPSCPGLTRSISTVDISDVGAMHECSDCAKKHGTQ